MVATVMGGVSRFIKPFECEIDPRCGGPRASRVHRLPLSPPPSLLLFPSFFSFFPSRDRGVVKASISSSSMRRGNKRLFIGRRVSRLGPGRDRLSRWVHRLTNASPAFLSLSLSLRSSVMNFISCLFLNAFRSGEQMSRGDKFIYSYIFLSMVEIDSRG